MCITYWISTKNAWNTKKILQQNAYIDEIQCEKQSFCQNSKYEFFIFFSQTQSQIHRFIWNNNFIK